MPAGPPKVLVIQREWTKPGKGGTIHEKSESNFVNAMTAAKWPTHYFAAQSLSGKSRVLFFVGYPSFEAWEKDNHAMEKNATLSAAWDHAEAVDGELLEDFQQDVFLFRPELSLHTGDTLCTTATLRYRHTMLKPGHRAGTSRSWRRCMSRVMARSRNTLTGLHSRATTDRTTVACTSRVSKMASLAENDKFMDDDKKFADAIGPEKMKKLRELRRLRLSIPSRPTCTNSTRKMSYPDESWIQADSFWKAKPAAAAAAAAKKAGRSSWPVILGNWKRSN